MRVNNKSIREAVPCFESRGNPGNVYPKRIDIKIKSIWEHWIHRRSIAGPKFNKPEKTQKAFESKRRINGIQT